MLCVLMLLEFRICKDGAVEDDEVEESVYYLYNHDRYCYRYYYHCYIIAVVAGGGGDGGRRCCGCGLSGCRCYMLLLLLSSLLASLQADLSFSCFCALPCVVLALLTTESYQFHLIAATSSWTSRECRCMYRTTVDWIPFCTDC